MVARVGVLLVIALGVGCEGDALVLSVEDVRDLGPYYGDQRVLRVDVVLENRTDADIPFNHQSFMLHPRHGAVVRGALRTEWSDGSCEPVGVDAELAPHSRARCAVVFVVPSDFEAVGVTFYSFAAERFAEAPVPPVSTDASDGG